MQTLNLRAMNFKSLTLFLTLCLTVSPVWAARAPAPIVCAPTAEAIVTLNVPFFGAATIWDTQFGNKDSMIQFAGGRQLESGNILAAGMEQDINFKPVNTVLVEIDDRSKIINDKRIPAKAGEQQSGMITLADHSYVIASTVQGGKKLDEKWTRLAHYSNDLNYKFDVTLKDNNFDYESGGLIPVAGGRGYVAIVHAINRKDIADEYSILFRLDMKGKLVWKRAYRPGIPNQIYGITSVDDRHMIAGGRTRHEDGRMAGWLMLLNEDGTIVWQNTMPRGQTSIIRAMDVKHGALDGEHYLITGQVIPYDIGNVPGAGAVWVSELDATGAVLWQRYLRTTSYNLDGRAIQVHPDGRITIMANADVKKGDEDGSNHIRLLTLSPRGDLMNDESYMQGRRADSSQLIEGRNRERIVIATIEAKTAESGETTELITDSIARKAKLGPEKPDHDAVAMGDGSASGVVDILRRQGWVFVATALPPYRDPCVVNSETIAP